MTKCKIELGNEVMVRATVIGIWDDGSVTVQIKNAGQRLTLTSDSDIERARPRPKKRKRERLL